MSAMTGPLAVRIRQLPFLNIHAAALANIRKSILLVFTGILQADAFSGYGALYECRRNRLRLLRPHAGVTEDGIFLILQS